MRWTSKLALAAMLVLSTQALAAPPPTATDAKDGIFAAFRAHPLVGIENREGQGGHDLAQQQDFYAALLRDPRFARDVGNIVLEFGGAAAQPIIDRYVNGQDVPYTELRKVWTDTVGWMPPPVDLGYVNIFAQVRATNLSLPPAQRIHVWLGEPPIDWAQVRTKADLSPFAAQRNTYPAGLIEREILAKNKKALVIYGPGHFMRDPVLLEALSGFSSIASLVERKHPGAMFIVYTYVGSFRNKACAMEFEKDKANLKTPALLTPVRGTTLDDPSFLRRCSPEQPVPPTVPKAKKSEAMEHAARDVLGMNDDAMLYLGPSESLTASPLLPDVYLDEAYKREIMRRAQIANPGAAPFDLGITVDTNPASPRPYQP